MNRFKNFSKSFDKEKIGNIYNRYVKKQTSKQAQAPLDEKKVKESETPSDKPIDIAPENKKPKYYINKGPHLYVSMLLNRKGPLTAKQIWHEYQKDEKAKQENNIRSLTYLKQTILKHMKSSEKIKPGGYSKVRDCFVGFLLNPENAFKNTHPDILANLNPKPNIKRYLKPDVLERINKKPESL